MSDIALQWSADLAADIFLDGDDIATDAGLQTAVMLSLFLDRRLPDDLVAENDDRRGWWGDEFAEVNGDQNGSRLWELERSIQTPNTANVAEQYTRDALQWMVDDGVAADVTVSSESVRERLELLIEIIRPTGARVRFRYDALWAAEVNRAMA